ncbi:peptide deformylase [Agrococcus sp. ARC_14]|uniref:peptide deformylase n=1 Tax=Agrococcus sp. ARC_14 TaxID=2919927 RepID=UPI001F0663D5|nr:peptide deformylase [Agrococcus sp. ARC_14]MCH1883493.1 peptide deformylase [Agrococcus sp. ARC_14]
MSVREIRVFGDPVLRERATPVDATSPTTAALVQDLLDTVRLPGRAGVAACQIGVAKAAFSYNVDGEIGYVLNPRIDEVRGEPELVDEGCLSVPELGFPTPRHPFCRVIGVDTAGEELVLEGEGLMAQMLQHEMAHLDGRLYLQALDKEMRSIAMAEVRKAAWY